MTRGSTSVLEVAAGTVSDGELVARLRDGDRAAFEELFARHEGPVTGVCRRRLTDAADVSDAVQETFLRALDRVDDLRDGEAFGGWVRAIAARVAVDQLRGHARSRSLDRVPDLVDDAAAPDEVAERIEDHARLRAALEGLGERDRTALWLRHGDEAPVAEIARALGLTEGSVRVTLTRARQRLRLAVSDLGALMPLPLFLRRGRGSLAARFPWLDPATVLVPLATAAAVAIVPAGGTSAPDVAPPVDAPASAVETTVLDEGRPVLPMPGGAVAPAAVEHSEAPAAVAADVEEERRSGPVAEIADDVRIQEGYPEDEQYTAEVRLLSADDDAGTWRLYGSAVDDPAGALADPVGAAEDVVTGTVGGLLGR